MWSRQCKCKGACKGACKGERKGERKGACEWACKGERNQGCYKAFTLLEVLIAILLLSVVMGLTYSTFGIISQQSVVLRDRLASQQQSRLLVEIIAADLQAIRWLPNYGLRHQSGIHAVTKQLSPEGKFTELSFHATRPALLHREKPEADPRLHEIGYLIEETDDPENFRLIRREDYYLDDNIQEGGRQFTITERLRGFQVEFLSSPRAKWIQKWDSKTSRSLPLAIRFTLKIAVEDNHPQAEEIPVKLEVHQIEINLTSEVIKL